MKNQLIAGSDIKKALPRGGMTEISKGTKWTMPVVRKVLKEYPEYDGNPKIMKDVIDYAIKIIDREQKRKKALYNNVKRIVTNK